MVGVVGLILFYYRHFFAGIEKMFWGKAFKAGRFFSIFSFLYLFHAIENFLEKRKINLRLVSHVVLFILSVCGVIFAGKRSFILAFSLAGIVLFLLFSKLFQRKKIIVPILFVSIFALVTGVVYVSVERNYNFSHFSISEIVQLASSNRDKIAMDAISIIKSDFAEGRVINILIGHGENCGIYLPHSYSHNCNHAKYESIFLLSEFMEKGLIGVFIEIFMIYKVFLFMFSLGKRKKNLILLLWGSIPLVIHFLGMIFVFLKDPTLPTWLLMFRLSENASKLETYERKDSEKENCLVS
jgi:4-amino-4-deoxy-L-arabinose transferase-like glycosyltransferase